MHTISSLFLISLVSVSFVSVMATDNNYISALGDPAMKSQNLRIALEAWNFCNEVGQETPKMGSPRAADCADLYCPLIKGLVVLAYSFESQGPGAWILQLSIVSDSLGAYLHVTVGEFAVSQKVTEADNHLGVGDMFPNASFKAYSDPDLYATEKELYLASLCAVCDSADPWHFWMIMLKNGNFDIKSALCPENGKKVSPIITDRKFPCFGQGCMNQPLIYHNWSRVHTLFNKSSGTENAYLSGSFYGTYDLDADLSDGPGNYSYFSVAWDKNISTGSWVISNKLKTSRKYPWLMLYLRADATSGFNGGYHYESRGIMRKLPESPNFKVRLTLNVKHGGGPNSQFYLVDIGSCWKNNGQLCDGDVETDVTRYSEMIINPNTTSWCQPNNLAVCPPYHFTSTGEKIYRNNSSKFPYSAYHLYCGPGNAKFLERPFDICDPYSNPQAQELVQILPHAEWAVHGYPSRKGDGWVGDSRTWELDVGALSSRLYFYQDPGTEPAKRVWSSINVGTEIYVSDMDETAEWTVSDFDVLIPSVASESGDP